MVTGQPQATTNLMSFSFSLLLSVSIDLPFSKSLDIPFGIFISTSKNVVCCLPFEDQYHVYIFHVTHTIDLLQHRFGRI